MCAGCGSAAEELFVAKYTNASQRACAESAMLADPKMRAALDAAAAAAAAATAAAAASVASTSTVAAMGPDGALELTLYLTINPCHYSSSTARSMCS